MSHNKEYLKYIEYRVVNIDTRSYEDSLFIFFWFPYNNYDKNILPSIEIIVNDLLLHIINNHYESIVCNDIEYCAINELYECNYEDPESDIKIIKYPIIDITNKIDTSPSLFASNICVQKINTNNDNPHYLITYTSIG